MCVHILFYVCAYKDIAHICLDLEFINLVNF